jgi:hypothetical protein
MPSQPQLPEAAALQKAIRRAGATTSLVRGTLQLAGHAARLLACLAIAGSVFAAAFGVVSFLAPLCLGLLALTALLAGAAGLAVPTAAAYRRWQQDRLRRRLARMPREAVAAVLLPLRDYAFPDTRRIVAPLILELRPEGTEVAPSNPPAGRGSEPAPAAEQAARPVG